MNILYVGTYLEEDREQYINYCSPAGNKFQKNLLNVLKEENKIDILTYIEYPLFPNGKKVIVFTESTNNIKYIKYINLPFLKNITISLNTYIFLLKNIKKYEVITSYNLFPAYLKPIISLKKILNVKVGSFIADLYIDEYKYDNVIKKVRKKIRYFKEKNLIKKLDFCIPITEYITKDLEFNGPSIVMEGGIDKNEFKEIEKIENNINKKIVYTGTIDSVNGIEMLVKVAEILKDDNFEFIVAGDGPLANYLDNKSKNLNNLNYIGKVSNQKCLEIQRKADLLVLFRPTNQKITRYTFPSKLHEYILSGRPVLITDLEGINDEYKKNVNIIKKEDEKYIANEIKDHFKEQEKMLNKAVLAKDFVLKNKTWSAQGLKINAFIEKILMGN